MIQTILTLAYLMSSRQQGEVIDSQQYERTQLYEITESIALQKPKKKKRNSRVQYASHLPTSEIKSDSTVITKGSLQLKRKKIVQYHTADIAAQNLAGFGKEKWVD